MLESVLVAIGCGTLWFAAAAWTRLRTPRRPPIDGGPVPETIRVALRAGSNRNDPSILNSAILELVETGLLQIEPADSQHPAMVRNRVLPHADRLPAYQASVVSRLLHRQGVSGMPVPLTALQPTEDPTATKWYRDFYKKVQRAAADQGLLQTPLSTKLFALLLVGGLVTSGFIAHALSYYSRATTGLPFAAFLLCVVVTWSTMAWAGRVRPTVAGQALAAGGTWTAGSPAPVAAPPRPDSTVIMPPVEPNEPVEPIHSYRQIQPAQDGAPPTGASIKVLPNQLEPLPANQVWSDYGGSWHPLDTNTKETYAVRSGTPVIFAPIMFGLLSVGGVIYSAHGHGSTPPNVLVVAVFGGLPLLLILGIAASTLRRRRLPKRAVIRGQVAKLWKVRHTSGENESTDYYCALDVGRGPESVRLKLGTGLFNRLQVGGVVEVLVNPRRKRIKDIRFVGHGD